ncbi:MAG: Zn-dependent alcohol dehydrogenase [Burkholderiaceae bacterium]
MTITCKAVVTRELNQPVVVETITVQPPQRGEITVKMTACGVCHSDLSVTNGTIGLTLPMVLGHEAAGVVTAVGDGVAGLAVGDHVVSSFSYMCGACRFCSVGRPVLCVDRDRASAALPDGSVRTFDAAGKPLNMMSGCGVMAEYATVSERSVVKIDAGIPLDRAALVGCAVTTGVGAAINTARVRAGSSVVVFGVGGVGLNVIQGASIAGAAQIVAVDRNAAKLETARRFGATDVLAIEPGEDPTKALKKMTGGGADYAFECVGSGPVSELAYKALIRGGMAVIVGVARPGDNTSVRTMTLPFEEKQLVGSYFGSSVPKVDFPKLLSLYQGGKLKLDELITRRYSIDEAPQAFADLESGVNARGVIVF